MLGALRRRAGGKSNFWLVFRRVSRGRQAMRVRCQAQWRVAIDPETPQRASGRTRPSAEGSPPK